MQHDIADRGFAGRTDLPLSVPYRRKGHGPQHADPVVATIAPLHETVLRIILPFDKAEDGSFDGMAYVRSHEPIAVAPTAKLGDRSRIVAEPVAVQSIPRTRFRREVKGVHDSGVQKRLFNSGPPVKAV